MKTMSALDGITFKVKDDPSSVAQISWLLWYMILDIVDSPSNEQEKYERDRDKAMTQTTVLHDYTQLNKMQKYAMPWDIYEVPAIDLNGRSNN